MVRAFRRGLRIRLLGRTRKGRRWWGGGRYGGEELYKRVQMWRRKSHGDVGYGVYFLRIVWGGIVVAVVGGGWGGVRGRPLWPLRGSLRSIDGMYELSSDWL